VCSSDLCFAPRTSPQRARSHQGDRPPPCRRLHTCSNFSPSSPLICICNLALISGGCLKYAPLSRWYFSAWTICEYYLFIFCLLMHLLCKMFRGCELTMGVMSLDACSGSCGVLTYLQSKNYITSAVCDKSKLMNYLNFPKIVGTRNLTAGVWYAGLYEVSATKVFARMSSLLRRVYQTLPSVVKKLLDLGLDRHRRKLIQMDKQRRKPRLASGIL